MSVVSEIPLTGASSLPNSTFSDIMTLKISHHRSIYTPETSKTIKQGFLFPWRAGC